MDRSQIPQNNSSAKPESFDVFLCHNSEDKPEIRRIADDLLKRGIKPWLDEREIMPIIDEINACVCDGVMPEWPKIR